MVDKVLEILKDICLLIMLPFIVIKWMVLDLIYRADPGVDDDIP